MQRDGDAAAAAAASYRVLSRLLGYGTGPEAGAAGGAGAGAGAAGAGPGGGGRLPGAGPALRSPRPQLMVFRNAAAEGRPGEDCGPAAAAAAAAAAGGGVPGGGGAELCPRHRCALEPKAAAGWGAAAQSGLELQLAALGLRPPGLGAKGAAGAAGTPCPCLGPPAGEETSDALLVLEALEPDEGGSGSEDEPGSPGRGAARAAGRASAPGPAQPPAGTGTGGRKGSLRIRLSRLFRTKSCSGGSATGDAASAAASAGSLTDVCGARGREQEPGRYGGTGLGWGGCRRGSAGCPGAVSPRPGVSRGRAVMLSRRGMRRSGAIPPRGSGLGSSSRSGCRGLVARSGTLEPGRGRPSRVALIQACIPDGDGGKTSGRGAGSGARSISPVRSG
ncbi:suppressor of cytokine signaling 7 [Geothlypis trichas]